MMLIVDDLLSQRNDGRWSDYLSIHPKDLSLRLQFQLCLGYNIGTEITYWVLPLCATLFTPLLIHHPYPFSFAFHIALFFFLMNPYISFSFFFPLYFVNFIPMSMQEGNSVSGWLRSSRKRTHLDSEKNVSILLVVSRRCRHVPDSIIFAVLVPYTKDDTPSKTFFLKYQMWVRTSMFRERKNRVGTYFGLLSRESFPWWMCGVHCQDVLASRVKPHLLLLKFLGFIDVSLISPSLVCCVSTIFSSSHLATFDCCAGLQLAVLYCGSL